MVVERRRPAERCPRTILVAGAAAACAALLVLIAAQLANGLVFDRRYAHLNADRDGNALTWPSALATAAAAAFVLTLARVLERRRLTIVGGILAFFAIDDVAGLHERMGDGLDALGLPHSDGIWFPVYLPLFGFVFLTLWGLARRFQFVAPAVRAGLLLLGFALAAEASTAFLPWLDRTEHGVVYTLEVGLEEGAELAGWILIGSGLAAAGALARAREEVTEALPLPHG
jgi:hypothetical protein